MATRRGSWRCGFVTGGGSGIGLAVAARLAEGGADVAVFDKAIDDDAREAISAAATSGGGRALFFEIDVTDPPAVRDAVDRAKTEIGGPDLALNSAGINIARPFHQLADAAFRRVIEVNLLGSRNFAHAVLPSMGAGGRLVFMASFAGLAPIWSYGAYSASKYGVIGLAGALRIESRPRGIRVSVVCPPNVPTPMSWEEERHMHPAQQALKGTAGEVSLDRVAKAILRGARHGRFLIIPGWKAKATYALIKFLPMGLAHAITDGVVRKALRAHPEGMPDWTERRTTDDEKENPVD